MTALNKNFVKLLSTTLVLTLVVMMLATNAYAMPAKPGLFDSKTGLSVTTGDPLPKLPDGVDEPEKISYKVIGTRNAIVILVEFTDNPADKITHTPVDYYNLLFSTGTYPTGSMNDYYQEISYNNFSVNGTITQWYTAPQTYSYYTNGKYGFGSYPQNAQKLVEDAVILADPVIDFSNYDKDGNGFVDALFVIHAGPGAEETGNANDLWSHKWTTRRPISVDGVKVFVYSMEPEEHINGKLISMGVFAHEFGHVLGLPDLYDTDYSSEGIGNYGLMSGGGWGADGKSPWRPAQMCAWSKIKLGWIVPTVVKNNIIQQPIDNIEQNPTVYKLWTNGNPGKEYFLVSNRQKIGFDSRFPGSGLLIWHIDDSVSNNNNENHKLVDLEEADGKDDLDYARNRGDAGDFYNIVNNAIFDDKSYPNSKAYDGTPTNVAVTNISASGDPMYA
ncbi:MAG: M6 family metalloprotease domain-containing protein, partial [Methanosarcinales archaeon]